MPNIPRFHLAMPVDDLDAARRFYGDTLGLEQGRSSDTWIDWNLHGHQFVTHLAPTTERVHNPVDGHDVPVPHFGLVLTVEEFHTLAEKLTAAGTKCVIEPYVRFKGERGEQWTMFFCDPFGNPIEVKGFSSLSSVYAT